MATGPLPDDLLTASRLQGATATAEYSWRAPSPPHIHIPQSSSNRKPKLRPFFGWKADFVDPTEADLLGQITQGRESCPQTDDWKYEMRRKAQPILPFLYLGPSTAARDVEMLSREGITMLLVIRNSMMTTGMLNGQKVAEQLGIAAATVDVEGITQLISSMPRAITTINDHLLAAYHHKTSMSLDHSKANFEGKVLIYCESGNDRSATVVVAYLMYMYGVNLVTAAQYVQNRRFCAAFDDTLKNLLMNFESILVARRSVTLAAPRPIGNFKAKRMMDVDDDEDGNMDDEARFDGRTSFMPFYDSGK